MGAAALPMAVVTAFWAVVAIVFPLVFGKGPNKGVIQVVCVLTGVSCWLFWLLAYLHQMNPLIGPSLHNTSIMAIMELWDETYVYGNHSGSNETHSMNVH